jgi:hypothetical protein
LLKPVRTCGFLLLFETSQTPLFLGKDATEAFEDVGHSDEARDIMKTLLVGDFEKTDVRIFFCDTQ